MPLVFAGYLSKKSTEYRVRGAILPVASLPTAPGEKKTEKNQQIFYVILFNSFQFISIQFNSVQCHVIGFNIIELNLF